MIWRRLLPKPVNPPLYDRPEQELAYTGKGPRRFVRVVNGVIEVKRV